MVQCGRCQAVIEYGTHADWPTLSLLINKHLGNCLARLNFHGPAPSEPSRPPSETYDAQSVCPTPVRCHGRKEIKLDKRSRYYPGLWTKHRMKWKCRGIQKIEEDKLDKHATSEDGVCPWSAEQRSTAARSFEMDLDDPRADGILRVANYVESSVSRQTELSDDEHPEDGDQGDQNVTFSMLAKGRPHRPWAYRYSTTKEIKERKINILILRYKMSESTSKSMDVTRQFPGPGMFYKNTVII
ncbi:hypothetical protein BDR04DRAFT_1112921 [Suillus decipiens]|nr:hypothetical protein BDR04DRAFT_1112921 [Suillus decipiens]